MVGIIVVDILWPKPTIYPPFLNHSGPDIFHNNSHVYNEIIICRAPFSILNIIIINNKYNIYLYITIHIIYTCTTVLNNCHSGSIPGRNQVK